MTNNIQCITTEPLPKDKGKIHYRLYFTMFKRTLFPVMLITVLVGLITQLATIHFPARYTSTAILRYTPLTENTSSPETRLEHHIEQLNRIEKINAVRINHSHLIRVRFETAMPDQLKTVAAAVLNRYINRHATVKTPAAGSTATHDRHPPLPAVNKIEYEATLAQLRSEILSQEPASPSATELSIFQAPGYPISTTTERDLTITLSIMLIGFSLCQLIILIASRYQEKINTTDDVKKKLHTELIACSLQGQNHCSATDKAIVERYSQHSFKQALLLNNDLKDKQILNLTSINPKEGTTFIVWQLARALSKNQKVLIIDLDINQHYRCIDWLSSSFELCNFGNTCDQTSEPNQIFSSTIKNIHLMPLDESRLLSSTDEDLQVLQSRLRELRKTYDRILFDSPPLTKSHVALIAGKIADGTLFILKPGRTSVIKIRRYMLQLLNNQTPIGGVILNKVKINTEIAQSLKRGVNWDIR